NRNRKVENKLKRHKTYMVLCQEFDLCSLANCTYGVTFNGLTVTIQVSFRQESCLLNQRGCRLTNLLPLPGKMPTA
ncbi:MAG: hypothetical protein ACE5IT_09480, partial [bacterium]